MDNTEKKETRRTIFLTVGCGVLLTAAIIFFILGLLKFNQSGRVIEKEKIIYVEPEYDEKGEDAEENAKVDLVKVQMMFEDKDQLVEYINVDRDIDEVTYMSDDLYGHEYEYLNSYGEQTYVELLYAADDNYVKRYIGNNFVGYTYKGEGGAFNYVLSKQHRLTLDAYTLDFEAYTGASSFFTTSDAEINELFAHYTHKEFDAENLKEYQVGLYPSFNYVTIMSKESVEGETEFLTVSPREHHDFDETYWEKDGVDLSAATPNPYAYANIASFMLPSDEAYSKYYVQPKNGYYGYGNGTSFSADTKEEYIIGFVDTGDKTAEYAQILLDNEFVLEGEEYRYTYNGWDMGHEVIYTEIVKLSYVASADTPSFESGLMLVDHSRTKDLA